MITKKVLSALVLFALVAFGFSPSAQAHAFLDHADPKVGATLTTSPTEVRAWFTEELEPAFSKMHVMDAAGNMVSNDDCHVDSSNPSLLVVSLKKLAPGTYKVMWKVVAKDTHHTQGTFTFEVKA
jgi:methionine-rich copper-binding protein CopC